MPVEEKRRKPVWAEGEVECNEDLMGASADLARSSKDAVLLRAVVHWSKSSRHLSLQVVQSFYVGCLRKGCVSVGQGSLQSKQCPRRADH